MKTLPAVDAVIVGGGWAGLLMAKELAQRTSLNIVVLERGPSRRASDYSTDMDELDYAIRFRMMQNLSKETVTLRHDAALCELSVRCRRAYRAPRRAGRTCAVAVRRCGRCRESYYYYFDEPCLRFP